MEYVDPVLLLMLISLVCLGICAWRSPRFLRSLAAYLLARADLIDICENARKTRPQYWRKKLGVEVEPGAATIEFKTEPLSRSELNAS